MFSEDLIITRGTDSFANTVLKRFLSTNVKELQHVCR